MAIDLTSLSATSRTHQLQKWLSQYSLFPEITVREYFH